jgi:hypothetical protein
MRVDQEPARSLQGPGRDPCNRKIRRGDRLDDVVYVAGKAPTARYLRDQNAAGMRACLTPGSAPWVESIRRRQ